MLRMRKILTTDSFPYHSENVDGIFFSPVEGYAHAYATGRGICCGEVEPSSGCILVIDGDSVYSPGRGDLINSFDEESWRHVAYDMGVEDVDEFVKKAMNNPDDVIRLLDWRVVVDYMEMEYGRSEIVVPFLEWDQVVMVLFYEQGEVVKMFKGVRYLDVEPVDFLYTGTPLVQDMLDIMKNFKAEEIVPD